MDIKLYWAERRKLETQLETITYLCSLEDPSRGLTGGRVCSADRETAARCLTEKTHRIASEGEIQKFHEDLEARNAICKSMTAQAQNKQTLTIDESLAKAIRVGK